MGTLKLRWAYQSKKERITLIAHMVQCDHSAKNVLFLSQSSKWVFCLKGLNVPPHLVDLADHKDASVAYQKVTQTSNLSSQAEEGMKRNRNSESSIKVVSNS